MENNQDISPYAIRRIILEQSKRANKGHIGSALSIADIISTLFDKILLIPHPKSPERDRFILSKGHSALALYAAIYLKGWISKKMLNSFCVDGTTLGVHPEHVVSGIEFITGSLGHGLSIGAGSAMAARLQNSPRRVFVIVSDGECNEGSLWEAIMFAAHHKLSNLVVIVDDNKQQAFGYTKETLNLLPMSERWKAFDWDVHEVDGHDVSAINGKINQLNFKSGPPHVIIANTILGKGVSYMEGKIKWHYWPMSDNEYKQALADIRKE